jgi:hypothetical protein
MFSGKRFALIAALTLSFLVPMQSPASASTECKWWLDEWHRNYCLSLDNVRETLQPQQELFWVSKPIRFLDGSMSFTEPLSSEVIEMGSRSFQTGLSWNIGNNISNVMAIDNADHSAANIFYCEGWYDPKCLQPGMQLQGNLVLPSCESQNQSSGCIDNASISRNGTKTQLKYVRSIDTTPGATSQHSNSVSILRTVEIPGIKTLNFPNGSSPSLWKTNSTNGGVNDLDTYFINTSLLVNLEVGTDKQFKNVRFSNFSITVTPTKEVSTPTISDVNQLETHSVNGKLQAVGVRTGFEPLLATIDSNRGTEQSGCVFSEKFNCGIAAAFSSESDVSVEVRLPSQVKGWLQGRADGASAEIRKRDALTNLVKLSGAPANVPMTAVRFYPKDVSAFAWQNCQGVGGSTTWDCFKELDKPLGDTAVGRASIWTFSSINGGGFTQCDSKTPRLEGLLTTNAMVYNGDLPTYKKGSLSYQVGGLHYNHDGTVFKGSYDFIMRSDTARCIYGFTKAPVQVAVTVTDVNGVQSASTSSVSESGGWLRIRARDFTFSTPTINAKITQKLSTSVKNDKISQKALAKIAKVSIGKKDKVTISVTGSNKKFAKVKSGNVSFKKNGTYQVKIKVKHHKGNTETATITVKVK